MILDIKFNFLQNNMVRALLQPNKQKIILSNLTPYHVPINAICQQLHALNESMYCFLLVQKMSI